MSLAAPRPAAGQRPQQYHKTLSATSHVPTPNSIYSDEDRFDRLYDLDNLEDDALILEAPVQTKMAIPAAVVVPVAVDGNTTTGPPSIPQKHNLRASRLLDAMQVGKLGAMLEPGMTTPHDVYLSSEEDASSSADDFSDYDYESSSEDLSDSQQSPNTPESPAASTPSRRRSHEVTARVVSVVFSGKPSVIELPKRMSRASDSDLASARLTQSTLVSGQSHEDILSTIPTPSAEIDHQEVTPRSSPDSSLASRSGRRRSTVLSAILGAGKPKPNFLSIDPFANGSTYSLDQHKEDNTSYSTEQHHHHLPFHPKSPTALFKKTIGTIRRRTSRQALNDAIFDSPPPPSRSSTTPISTTSFSVTSSPVQLQRPSLRPVSFYSSSSSTAESTLSESSVTYNDIIRAAKRNASKAPPPMMLPPMDTKMVEAMAPQSPTKKGIMKLRRRSQKIMNGRLV